LLISFAGGVGVGGSHA